MRISGLRLDGGQTNPTESAGLNNDADAITVLSSTNVEIDHLTLYQWRGSAVNIQDNGTADRLNATTAATVWVHDNYIHDNQHPTTASDNPFGSGHGAGYGVNVNSGGYALIERNVFDANRHSITSDGKTGSGYLAYRNLFLTFGIGGTASAVHLRGTPEVGMDSENNVFAQSSGDAIEINETGYMTTAGTFSTRRRSMTARAATSTATGKRTDSWPPAPPGGTRRAGGAGTGCISTSRRSASRM